MTEVKIPEGTEASFFIRTIDILLQIDDHLKNSIELDHFNQCRDFFKALFISQNFMKKLSQNIGKTRHLLFSSESEHNITLKLTMAVLMKNFESIGQTIRDAVVEINKLEFDDNYDYHQEYDIPGKLECMKEKLKEGDNTNLTVIATKVFTCLFSGKDDN